MTHSVAKTKPIEGKPPAPDMLLALAYALAGGSLMTVVEAADCVGRTPACVRLWCERGKLGFRDERLGVWLISQRELATFVESRCPAWWRSVPERLKSFAPTQSASVLNIS